MAFKHGKDGEFTFDAVDLSAFSDSIEWNHPRDTAETTVFGLDDKTYLAGHHDTTFTVGGKFDAATSGPRDTLLADDGIAKAYIVRPEGTGAGLSETTGDAIVSNYTESVPVGDVITWSADFQGTGPVTTSAQI